MCQRSGLPWVASAELECSKTQGCLAAGSCPLTLILPPQENMVGFSDEADGERLVRTGGISVTRSPVTAPRVTSVYWTMKLVTS